MNFGKFGLQLSFASISLACLSTASLAADGDVDPIAALTRVHAGDPGVPDGVPDGYVITPAGYFHPSCVRHVAADEVLDMAGGGIRRGDGSLKQPASPCAHARFLRNGTRIGPSFEAPAFGVDVADRVDSTGSVDEIPGTEPNVTITADTLFVGTFDKYDGWVESIYARLPLAGSISYLRADMFVPAAARHASGSVNFFFPGAQGLQDTGEHYTILQPVLQWNNGLAGWSIASWNCCVDGNVNAGDFKAVAVGHRIQGLMIGSGCSTATGVCQSWLISTLDVDSGESSLLNTTGYNQAFNWAFGAVLEVYGVASCDDLSATGYMTFNDIRLKDVADQPIVPTWLTGHASSSVACNYGAFSTSEGLLLRFQPGV